MGELREVRTEEPMHYAVPAVLIQDFRSDER